MSDNEREYHTDLFNLLINLQTQGKELERRIGRTCQQSTEGKPLVKTGAYDGYAINVSPYCHFS
jgi:hypothetical protein